MDKGNPGEIDFGSSKRAVRVCEGSSFRESTQCISHSQSLEGYTFDSSPNKVNILSQKRLMKAPYYVKGYT